jgi:hypothetical protein
MRRLSVVGAMAALMGSALVSLPALSASGSTQTGPSAMYKAVKAAGAEHETFCQRYSSLCTEPAWSIGPAGEYTGHDEPSVLFRSNKPGTGYDLTYQVKLPTNPPIRPKQDGGGGTWDFQLRPTFWLGLTMCDTESAPEYTRVCQPDTDANARYTSPNAKAPNYIGRHPGNAFLELQFYEPGYVPQFEGYGCTATKWCANMTIDSLLRDQNTGRYNTDACNDYPLAGPEPINWAYVTKSGKSQGPANPLQNGTAQVLNPDPKKDLLMGSGDTLIVHMHDTNAGFRVDINDRTTGAHGSMTASIANGFGQIRYTPNAKTCSMRPYAFHPEYSTAASRGNTWSVHTYNIAYSDEIGHFELCGAIAADGSCAKPIDDSQKPDPDDVPCLPGKDSPVIHITSCNGTDIDFDGLSYQPRWPGTIKDPAVDQRLHPTPVMFTSPTSRGRSYESAAFEADLPRIEATDSGGICDRATGANCTNPPPGARFYPFFTTTHNGPGACAWQEGGPYIPGTVKDFGGSAKTAFGGLAKTLYPEPGWATTYLYNNFYRDLGGNPC